MKDRKIIIFIFLVIFSFTNKNVNAQVPSNIINYYKAWENALYPLQYSLVYKYWSVGDIELIEKLPTLEKNLNGTKHPEYFTIYPKTLKGLMQSGSIDGKNYKEYSAFRIAGENDDPPKDGAELVSFYKRYCYWRKLMDDKEEVIFDNAAKAMLEAENAREDERKEKLAYMVRYSKALKIVFPNSKKADYMIERTTKNSNIANANIAEVAYYKEKARLIDRYFSNLSQNPWDADILYKVQQFNFPEFYSKMEADKKVHPECFKIYPALLPGNGMNCITKKNLDQFTGFTIAGADEKPPQNSDVKVIVNFYKAYAFWKQVMKNNSEQMIRNLRNTITKVDNRPINYRYEDAVFALEYAKALHGVCPDNERINELVNDANETYSSTVNQLRSVFTGKFHEKNLQKIYVFKNKPVWGKENEADIISEVKVGEPAWITGFFTAVNSMGLPTLVFMDNTKKYSQGPKAWVDKTDHQAMIPMFNQLELKAEYKSKAYFTFNMFPDIEKTNYKSHVQYFPHLNFIKWLTFQPAEVLDLKVKYGKSKKMAEGVIKIDLTGDNKAKLKEYYKKLEAKRLSMVTFPDMCGTADARTKISNFSDLSKYGKVLRITLRKAGNIMKPFPLDDQVDWNTAKGFMAVEKDGKVIILALDFRKRPSAGKWQWWSLGSFPGLFPATDYGYSEFNAVKKISGGYEIPKANVYKSSTWYVRD